VAIGQITTDRAVFPAPKTREQLTAPLTSNGYTLDMSPNRLGDLPEADAHAPLDDLREQLARDGFLWFRSFLDPDKMWDFRERYFEAHREAGLLAPGSAAVDGLYSGEWDSERASGLQYRIARWASYDALTADERLVSFFEELLGGEAYLHRRKIIRSFVHGSLSSGAHYDLTYFRKGTEKVFTVWIPLGDIPIEMGGLVYLEGSHTWGREVEAQWSIVNGDLPPEERISAFNKNMTDNGWISRDLPSLAERLDTRWLCANYEAGDIVIHSAYAIHAATDNVDPHGRIRLSTDIRYQLMSDPIDERWAEELHPSQVGVV
jgi:hypothetical protein